MTDSREPNGVPLTTRPSKSREGHSPTQFALRIDEVEVIEDPKWVYTWNFGYIALLPIEPPEVDAFIFEWMMDSFEVSLDECLVGAVEFDGLQGYRQILIEKRNRRGGAQLTSLDSGSRSKALHIRL